MQPTDPHGLPDDVLQRRLHVPTHVVYRTFAEETIALNLDAGTFHGLNPTAGRMVEVAREQISLERAATVLAGEYGLPRRQVEDDLRELVASLAARGLIELS